jgi:cytidylate kinase
VGFEIISAGTIFRDLAKENQLSVEEFNKKVNEDIQRGDHSVDDLIDQRTMQIDAARDNVVFDSRLAWNFAPRSFKVFVTVDIEEAARRVYGDAARADSESYSSQEECRKALLHRQEMEKQRFQELYHINYFDMNNYDLVIESTAAAPSQVAERILACFQEFQQTGKKRVELNPGSLYPTQIIAPEAFQEADINEPIQITQVGGTYFVLQGHETLWQAMKSKQTFVAVTVLVSDDPDEESLLLHREEYQAYEGSTGQAFRRYPDSETLSRSNLLTFA